MGRIGPAGGVVGHHVDRRIGNAELTGQRRLGHAGHADDVAAVALEAVDLRRGLEALIDRKVLRHVRELIPPALYLQRSYYDHWYMSYVAALLDGGWATEAEIISGRAAPDSGLRRKWLSSW